MDEKDCRRHRPLAPLLELRPAVDAALLSLDGLLVCQMLESTKDWRTVWVQRDHDRPALRMMRQAQNPMDVDLGR